MQLQLPDARTFDRKVYCVNVIPSARAELNRGHTIAVNRKLEKGRLCIQAFAEHDNRLSMGVAFRKKLRSRSDGEVTRYLFPNVVELVRLTPDIGSRARDCVLSSSGVKIRSSLDRRCTYVIRVREDADTCCLSESRRN